MTQLMGEMPQPPEAKIDETLKQQAIDAVFTGLMRSYEVHEELGPDGVNAKRPNQFGETALVADVGAEEAVLSALGGIDARIEVVSEEHGTVIISEGNASGKKLFGVLDGLDGSSVYQKERGEGRYGTMFALFDNDNPKYSDYVAAGIMEHSTQRLFLAVQGEGLRIIDVETGEVTYPKTRGGAELSADTVAFVDNGKVAPENSLYPYFTQNDEVFGRPLTKLGITTRRTGSSAAYYAAIGAGEADVVGESTRKGNLEFATAYAVVTAAGGVMQTLDGRDLGEQKFREFGQDKHVAILTAANAELADAVRAQL